MKVESSLKILSFAAYALAGASYFYGWSSDKNNYLSNAMMGVQSFAIASIFDRVLKACLAKNRSAENTSLKTTFGDPLIEEIMYSGILLTQSNLWMIPRFLTATCTGAAAARALTGRVTDEQNKQGLSLDTKIGFCWAIAREMLVQALPTSPLPLVVLDSCVFGLAEVCPKKEGPELPKFNAQWSYKLWSGAFFRGIANTVALSDGIIASITQHFLFNCSRFYQKQTAHT